MRDGVKDTMCITLPLATTNGTATVWVRHGQGLVVQERGDSLRSCQNLPPRLTEPMSAGARMDMPLPRLNPSAVVEMPQ